MHDLRQNNEEEIELFKVRFKLPLVFKILYVSAAILFFALSIVGIILLSKSMNNYYYWHTRTTYKTLGIIFIVAGVVCSAIFVLLLLFHSKLIKKNECTITSKRIYGIKSKGLKLTSYSHRLDDVDDIQVSTCLGFNSVTFRFSAGFVGLNPVYRTSPEIKTFKLSYVDNYRDLYDNLAKLQAHMKNEKDALLALELKRIEAEAKKAAALEHLAEATQK